MFVSIKFYSNYKAFNNSECSVAGYKLVQTLKYEIQHFLIQLFNLGPTICKNVWDLKDKSGNYIKTVCTVYTKNTQSSARTACTGAKMQLYKFNYAQDEAVLLAYADSQWPKQQLWVEGGNTTSCRVVSNLNQPNFVTMQIPCGTSIYSYCEYKSKLNRMKCVNLQIDHIILFPPSAATPQLSALLEPIEGKNLLNDENLRCFNNFFQFRKFVIK